MNKPLGKKEKNGGGASRISVKAYPDCGKSERMAAVSIWNSVVEAGLAFPQTERLTPRSAKAFFASQSFSGVAFDSQSKRIVGVYILHPNNVGRCGHICNASYAVDERIRGRGYGEQLVCHSMQKGKALGFSILQFNAVVATNQAALRLYEKLGFTRLGIIPKGFQTKQGDYADIIPHYIAL